MIELFFDFVYSPSISATVGFVTFVCDETTDCLVSMTVTRFELAIRAPGPWDSLCKEVCTKDLAFVE